MSVAIYYIGFVFLSVASFLSISREGKRYGHILLMFAAVLMILISGLRDNSPDQNSYRNIFYKVAPLDEVLVGNHNYHEVYGEWGYLFLNSLIKLFSNSDVVLFLTLALLTIGMVTYVCRRISPYPLISLLCYYSWFYYSNLGALRHALASSFILMGVFLLAKNRKLLATPFYLSAVFVHQVSISAAMLWFSGFLARWRLFITFLVLFAIVISLMGGMGEKLLSVILPFMSENVKDKLLFYSQSDMWGTETGMFRGVIIKQLAISSVCLFYMKTLKNKFDCFSVVFGSYIIGLLILLLFQDFKIVADRFSNVFSISEIILIPMLLSLIPGKEKIIALGLLMIVLFYQVYRLVGEQFYPYKFIFL